MPDPTNEQLAAVLDKWPELRPVQGDLVLVCEDDEWSWYDKEFQEHVYVPDKQEAHALIYRSMHEALLREDHHVGPLGVSGYGVWRGRAALGMWHTRSDSPFEAMVKFWMNMEPNNQNVSPAC